MNEDIRTKSNPRADRPLTLADAVERAGASVVGLMTRQRGPSAGVLWQPGVVLTTASAVGHADRVHVTLPDAHTIVGEVRGTDSGTDIAVVTLITPDLPIVERDSDAPLRVGDFVFAVGRDGSGQVHASFGHIGAAGGAWRTWRGGQVERLVRLDGGLYPGLNGAAVADAQGRFIGIASAALSRRHGVVLPLATLERISGQLLAHGHVLRGHIGVAAQAVAMSADMMAAASTRGSTALLIAGVGESSPAATAGLLVGDLIVSADGREVTDINVLRELLGADRIGTSLRLGLLRGGRPLELGVDVAEHRPAAACG